MSYSLVSGLTCSFDVLLYSQTSLGISHDTIMFHAGDGTVDTLLGVSTDLPNDVTEWQYTTTHTYASASTYVATVSDSFRVGGILNIANSVSEPIHLQQEVMISPFIGTNTSPVFGNTQLDSYADGSYYYHDPMVSDLEGDSLGFSLVSSSSGIYTMPTYSIDPITGVVQVLALQQGLLAINLEVQEYRNGTPIGRSYREMLFDSQELGLDINDNETTRVGIYPNPVQNDLTIELQDFNSGQFIIRDILGKQILTGSLNSKKQLVDISSLSDGTYFLTVLYEHDTYTKKIIKN